MIYNKEISQQKSSQLESQTSGLGVQQDNQKQSNQNIETYELKHKQKLMKKLKKMSDQEKLQYFEDDNKEVFQLIDQMHLANLDQIVFESTTKFREFMKNLQNHSLKLKDRTEQIRQYIQELHLNSEKIEGDPTSKPQIEKEYQTSQIIEVAGELPKLIKKVVKNSDMNLSKIKQLLQTQTKLVDSLQNSIREIVSKINPYELGILNVKGKQPLEELFELLFEILYSEPKEKFQWKEFKYIALLSEDGSADFLYRLANFDMKQLNQAQLENIKKNKDSNELRSYLEDPKIGELLIEIADWLEFIYHGHFLVNELHEIEELYLEAKQTVEEQERKQRNQVAIEQLKSQRIQEIQSQQQFTDFISNMVIQIQHNYEKTQEKLRYHQKNQQDIINAIFDQNNQKQASKQI
ncbi:hypothetical protein ABPG73_002244 [Tetrahymena malaccensis]